MLLLRILSKHRSLASVLRFGAALAIVSGTMISTAPAAFIDINSLGANNNGGTIIGTPTAGNWAASQFQVGPDTPLSTVSQITLALEQGGTGISNLAGLTLSIYSDIAGSPGVDLNPGPLNHFLNAGTLSGPASVVFTAVNPFTFAANTTYWLVLESAVPFNLADSVRWTYNEDSASLPLVGINGQINNLTTATFNSGVNWNVNANRYYRFAINVPEPSTYAMGAAGAMLMGVVARRKKRVPA